MFRCDEGTGAVAYSRGEGTRMRSCIQDCNNRPGDDFAHGCSQSRPMKRGRNVSEGWTTAKARNGTNAKAGLLRRLEYHILVRGVLT